MTNTFPSESDFARLSAKNAARQLSLDKGTVRHQRSLHEFGVLGKAECLDHRDQFGVQMRSNRDPSNCR